MNELCIAVLPVPVGILYCILICYCLLIRPPQDVDVLAVVDFQIPCYRPETPALYPRRLLINHEGPGRTLGRP